MYSPPTANDDHPGPIGLRQSSAGGDVAQSVAMDKDYSVRATGKTGDELGQLIDGFNEMLSQIQERDANLEHRVRDRTRPASCRDSKCARSSRC